MLKVPTKFGGAFVFCQNVNPIQDQDRDHDFTFDFNTRTTFYT